MANDHQGSSGNLGGPDVVVADPDVAAVKPLADDPIRQLSDKVAELPQIEPWSTSTNFIGLPTTTVSQLSDI